MEPHENKAAEVNMEELAAATQESRSHRVMQGDNGGIIKAWVEGVPFEEAAQQQLKRVASLPFIYRWVAAMPDVHEGKGATIGSVIATKGAIIPAAVGVDLGCGMIAQKTSLVAADLPDSLAKLRTKIEAAVPHGRTDNGGRNDRGAWSNPPQSAVDGWLELAPLLQPIADKFPQLGPGTAPNQMGTLGTGNHFIELCLDEADSVWIMLHSGSRGIGNRIGSFFIEQAKKEMRRWFANLPDQDLAYLSEGSTHFKDYCHAVEWAQNYARINREVMMKNVIVAMQKSNDLPDFTLSTQAVNCHHNYISREKHYGESVIVTRKGAVRARKDELGIIPGSMGARSFIVRGKGNPESFESCSHGAGRVMSRTQAKKRFSIADHIAATEGVECRKDADVIDETPAAYKSIDQVMHAQRDLVEIVHTLKQVLCVKG
jgi:tRNA-splicing ligase RtcB